MFRFIKWLFNFVIFAALAAVLAYLIMDPTYLKNILEEVLANFDERVYQISAIIVLIVYFVVFILSYIELLFKKKRKVSVKTKNGEIEVNFSTLENITKSFLEAKDIVKQVKVNVIATNREPNLEANVECFKTNNLNVKLDTLKLELEEHIVSMVGVKPKKIKIKVIKIDESNEIMDEIVKEEYEEISGENIE